MTIWLQNHPSAKDPQQWLDLLTIQPEFPDDLSFRPHAERRAVLRDGLRRRFFAADGRHLELAAIFEEMLFDGTCGQDVRLLAAQSLTSEPYQRAADSTATIEDNPLGGVLLGCPGLGKTHAVRAIASRLERLTHQQALIDGRSLQLTQIRWLFVRCPENASLLTYGDAFFQAMSEALGVRSLPVESDPLAAWKVKRDSRVIPDAVASFTRQYGVGLLIIDEIQNLDARFTQGRQKLINHFTRLIDETGVSLLLIGAGSVVDTFLTELRFGRRVGQRPLLWDPPENDDEFQAYLRKLFALQITNDVAACNDGMCDAFWQVTQGVFALCNTLFEQLQLLALTADMSRITEEMVRSAGPAILKLHEYNLHCIREQRAGRRCNPGDARLFNL